jgi:hypothetical protein
MTEVREGAEKRRPALISQQDSGKRDNAIPSPDAEQSGIWKTKFGPDPEIINRLFDAMALRGKLPCFQRGRMVYDFKAGRVRIEAVA